MTGLKIRQLRSMKCKLLFTSLAVFALVAQPLYGFVASQVANAMTAAVTTQQELKDAVANTAVSTIAIGGTITTTEEIVISRNVTLQGGTLKAGFNENGTNNSVVEVTGITNAVTFDGVTIVGNTNLHGINAYVTNIVLNNTTINNNGRTAVNVNGSVVTINSLTTAGNGRTACLFGICSTSHGVIDLAKGNKVTRTPTLNVNGPVAHAENLTHVRFAVPDHLVDDTQLNQYYGVTGGLRFKSAPAAPAITAPADGSTVASSTVNATWSAPSTQNGARHATASYNVSIDGGPVTNVAATSHTFTGLANGSHTISVQSVAASGLVGGTVMHTFTVAIPDTARPTVSNISMTPRINGNIGGTVTVTFDLEDETGIDLTKTRVLFADGPNTSNAAKESAKFTPVLVSGNTYQVEIDTLDFVKANWTGNYSLTFNLWDTLGNQGSSKPADFRPILIDNSGPTSVWTAPANNDTVNGMTRFSFDVSDHTGVKSGYVKLNGPTTKQVNLVQDGTSSIWYADIDTTELTDGSYTVDARFVDLFDKARYGANKGAVVIDSAAPTVPTITAPGVRQWFNGGSTINSWTASTDASGIAEYEVKYEFVGRPTAFRTVTAPAISRTQTFSGTYQGPITISVRAKDNAGNWSAYSRSVTYNYDSIAPTTDIHVSMPTGGTFTVSGDASDNVQLNRVYVQLVSRVTGLRCGGTTINLIPNGATASWAVNYDLATLGANCPEGDFAAHVEVVDMAGNRGTAGWTDNFLVQAPAGNTGGDNGDPDDSTDNNGGTGGENENGNTGDGEDPAAGDDRTDSPAAGGGDNAANSSGGQKSGSQNSGNQITRLIEAVLPTQPLLVTSLPTTSAPQALALFSTTTAAAQSTDADVDTQDEQDTDKPSRTAISRTALSDASEEGEVQAAQDTRTSWSAVNAVLAVIAAIAGLMTLLGLFGKRDEDEESRNGTRVVSVVLGGASVAALVLLEDFAVPIGIVNWWTIAFGAVALVQIAIVTSLKAPKS